MELLIALSNTHHRVQDEIMIQESLGRVVDSASNKRINSVSFPMVG